MSRNLGKFLLCVLLAGGISLCASCPVAAQTTFGSISGTVTDPSGAVVPGAKVTVTNQETRVERQVSSSGAGVFNVPNLNVGTYGLRIEATGFAVYGRTGLVLNTNQVLNVDAQLLLASAATRTEVTAVAPTINTETSNLATVQTSHDLEQLPVVARHTGDQGIYAYPLLNPGVNAIPDSSMPNFQGVRAASGTISTMDGIAVMAYPLGPGPESPSLESIQEVNIQTADPQAEFPTAASLSVVTKSGTNVFHGGAFYNYNGNSLNARGFFDSKVPFRVYNYFAGTIGGPIRKNKTFFFANYEASREAAKRTLIATVPLPAWRTGDFRSLCSTFNSSGICTVGTQLMNPFTGQPFLNNQILSINPVSQNIQNYVFPMPNFGPPGLQSGNWHGVFPGVFGFTHYDHFDGRVDHNFSSRDTIYGRVSWRRMPLAYTDVLPTIGSVHQVYFGMSGVTSWTHIFSPTLVNELRAGGVRVRNFYQPDTIGLGLLKQFGINGIQAAAPLHNVPIFRIDPVTYVDMDGACDSHYDNPDVNFEWTDNLSWTKGKHFLKFGLDAIRDQLGGEFWSSSMYGEYNFNGVYTGLGYADFLLGIPQTTGVDVPTPRRHFRGTTWGIYAQDEFKFSRKLTLNYGFRWQLAGPYYDRFGAMYNFDPKSGALVVPDNGLKRINPLFPSNIPIVTASQAGYPANTLMNFDKRGFQPRIGFAYKPFANGQTVVRAGYGIYSNYVWGNMARHMNGGPFSGHVTYTNQLTNGVPLFSFPDPFLTSGTTSTQDVQGSNPNLRSPYTQQWNFTVERQVGSMGLRASYVGTRSVNLLYRRNLNQPPPSLIPFSDSRHFYPTYNQIIWTENGGDQAYHGLELAAKKTQGKNLTFSSGWTWGRDLTDTQDNTATYAGQVIQNQFDRRAEKANNQLTLTHRFFGYALYTLPLGRDQRFLSAGNRWVEGGLGGWSAVWNVVLQSGEWFTPTFDGFDPSNTNSLGGFPDRIRSGKLSSGQSIGNWFDVGAFKIPGCPDTDPLCLSPANVGRFGNSGSYILRGPRLASLDFSITKYFHITERARLQFRLDMINALNHPNFQNPNSDISNGPGVAGTISGATRVILGELPARELDLDLRLEF